MGLPKLLLCTSSRVSVYDHSLTKSYSKNGPGPIRTKPRGQPRNRAPKQPKTVEDLDKELDAFMKDDAPGSAVPSAVPTAPRPKPEPAVVDTNGDVEMAT